MWNGWWGGGVWICGGENWGGKKERKKKKGTYDLGLVYVCWLLTVEGKIIYKEIRKGGKEKKKKEWEDKFYHKIKQKYYQKAKLYV